VSIVFFFPPCHCYLFIFPALSWPLTEHGTNHHRKAVVLAALKKRRADAIDELEK
jgi:hypothetical protein